MNAEGMVVMKSFWFLTGTPCCGSCMSLTSCSSLSKTAGLWEMVLEADVAIVADGEEDSERGDEVKDSAGGARGVECCGGVAPSRRW